MGVFSSAAGGCSTCRNLEVLLRTFMGNDEHRPSIYLYRIKSANTATGSYDDGFTILRWSDYTRLYLYRCYGQGLSIPLGRFQS